MLMSKWHKFGPVALDIEYLKMLSLVSQHDGHLIYDDAYQTR